MKTPAHWKHKNILAAALLPFGLLYAAATALRLKLKRPRAAARPIVCIGNLTAGGTGKTPTAVSVAKILKEQGLNPFFVSRGYGGSLSGVIVDRQLHSAAQTGDEPLLLAREAGVSVNADRFKAAQKATEAGADVLIMDDGFQNPGLKKDVSLLVFDGGFGVGNALPLPAGPLRENFKAGLKRADAAVIIGDDATGLRGRLGSLPIFNGKMRALPLDDTQTPAIAFAGIGRPEKFYNSLRELGVTIVKTFDFPDHHAYREKELHNLIDLAWKEDAQLITTAKDFVKIPRDLQHHFKVLEIEIEWQDKKALADFLKDKLKN